MLLKVGPKKKSGKVGNLGAPSGKEIYIFARLRITKALFIYVAKKKHINVCLRRKILCKHVGFYSTYRCSRIP